MSTSSSDYAHPSEAQCTMGQTPHAPDGFKTRRIVKEIMVNKRRDDYLGRQREDTHSSLVGVLYKQFKIA